MKKAKFPQFGQYVCPGDSITWEKEGFEIVARIEFDQDSRPEDSDCYTKRQIDAWRNDEWFFCGVVLSVSLNGVMLAEHAASLWGVDCNFPSRRKNPNHYLAEVAQELESEALDEAKRQQYRILEALGA